MLQSVNSSKLQEQQMAVAYGSEGSQGGRSSQWKPPHVQRCTWTSYEASATLAMDPRMCRLTYIQASGVHLRQSSSRKTLRIEEHGPS